MAIMNTMNPLAATLPAPARKRSARARKLFVIGLAQIALMAWIGLNVQTGSHDNGIAAKSTTVVASAR